MDQQPRWADIAVVALGGSVIAALTMLPAGEVRVGSETRVIHLGEFLGFRALLLTVCVALTVVAGFEMLMARRRAIVAAIGYGTLLLVTTMWIVTVEGVGLLIPRRLLPAAVRRFSLGLGASPGPWFVIVLCSVVILACLGLLEPLLRRFARQPEESAGVFVARLGFFALTAVGVTLLGFGRSTPLASVEWAGRSIEIESWAISYIGPGSLVVVLIMIGSGLCVAGRWHITPFALVGAGVAWIAATVAGLLVATSSLMVQTDLVSWAGRRLGQEAFADAVNVSGGSGAVLMFLGAVAAGIGFSAQLAVGGTTRE